MQRRRFATYIRVEKPIPLEVSGIGLDRNIGGSIPADEIAYRAG
jgi:hypothetical protein